MEDFFRNLLQYLVSCKIFLKHEVEDVVKLNLLSVVKTHGFFGLVFVIKTSGLSLSLPLEDMAVSEFGVVSFTANGRPALELDLAFVEFTLADSPEGWIGRFELCLEIKHKVSGTTLGWLVWGVV